MDKSVIEQIKAVTPIRQLMTENGVQFKGNQACCPFHEEKTPSFTVYPGSNTYYCFSCQAKGDVISYYQHVKGVDFMTAVRELGQLVGIEVDNNISTKFEESEDPKAAAKYYMSEVRGLVGVMNGEQMLPVPSEWYEQEVFAEGGKSSATVRFKLADGVWWERIIDAGFSRKANFRGSYKGLVWQIPTQVGLIHKNDTVYITEGIFDAIALWMASGGKYKVVSAMSTSNYPTTFIGQHKGKNIKWVLALDRGTAGANAAKKWHQNLQDAGEQAEVYYPADDRDWNDLYKQKAITTKYLQECYFRGMRLVSNSAAQKFAWVITEKLANKSLHITSDIITFNHCYYSCAIDFKELPGGDYDQAVESGDYKGVAGIVAQHTRVKTISTAIATLLYTQYNKVDDEHSYYFDVFVKGVKKAVKTELNATNIADATAFNKALLSKVGQTTFSGDNKDMRVVMSKWFLARKPTINTIRYMGYAKEYGAYIFPGFAYKQGKYYQANEQNYISIGNNAIKTTFSGWQVAGQTNGNTGWFGDFDTMAGDNGITGLAFWLMSLFAQQVRSIHQTIPFWEFTGVAGAGKSTIIEFLWRLVGRDDYEGVDPQKMSFVALSRTMMQASNIPVVLLEGDRDEKSHRMVFDMDQIKTLFRGQSPYGRAIKNNGIETDNEPFYGTIVVSQNAPIDGEPQILTRFVQCNASKDRFSSQTYTAANRIKSLKTDECVYFLHQALNKEQEILNTYTQNYNKYRDRLLAIDEIKEVRIAENHAQIMAFGKCLQLVVPQFVNARLKKWLVFMKDLAVKRQIAVSGDHPLVAEFWDLFEDYNTVVNERFSEEKLNHSRDDSLIAVNLNHLKEYMADRKHFIDVAALKKLLPNSKRYKFVAQRKVNSSIKNRILHCWVFVNE
jgi:DNA primase